MVAKIDVLSYRNWAGTGTPASLLDVDRVIIELYLSFYHM